MGGRQGQRVPRLVRLAAVAATAATLALTAAIPADAATATSSQEPEAATELAPTLLNGWSAAPFGTRTVKAKLVNGIVRLRGAVAGGSDSELFVLPPNMHPSSQTYIPIDLCGAANGRLLIEPDGTVEVEAEGAFSDAQCFTSLDGAWFAHSPPGVAPITLLNGWFRYGTGTQPKVAFTGGVVYFRGAMGTDLTNRHAFTLPVALRPAKKVYVPVDLCNATDGRLLIKPSGQVVVQADDEFGDAQCFTSLEGASFILGPPGTVNVPLLNGWTGGPFNTRSVKASLDGGVVRLRGAMATAGVNEHAFTLPAPLRPAANVYVQVDLCGAANGRLLIESTGEVTVETENDFSDAQCFTSLEGVSFVRG
jgi:hypothetical protein